MRLASSWLHEYVLIMVRYFLGIVLYLTRRGQVVTCCNDRPNMSSNPFHQHSQAQLSVLRYIHTHRIINDRIEKSIKGKQLTYWGKGEGFALHFYHGSNVGRTGIALAHPATTSIPHAQPGLGTKGGQRVRQRVSGRGGGEESGVNLPSAKKFFIAAMLL